MIVDNVIIREYQVGDSDKILELLNRNLSNHQHLNLKRDKSWWEWKYDNNVFGTPIVYVAEYKDEIIACKPMWPWELYLDGIILKCYQPVDAVVDVKFRGQGIFTTLTEKMLADYEGKIDILFNFSNEQSIRANQRLGWEFVGKLEWFVKVKKPIKSLKQLKDSTDFISVKLLEEHAISLTKIHHTKETYHSSHLLQTVRTKKFLKWRYLQHPFINYGMGIIENSGRQMVYVYEVNENKHGREMIILDYYGEDELFENMMKEIEKIAISYRVSFISLISKPNTPNFIMYKKLYVKLKKKNFLVKSLPSIEKEAVKYKNWDMFLGMHDSV